MKVAETAKLEPQIDLPFLSLELVSTTERPSLHGPDIVHRHYHYRVGFKSKPTASRFLGVPRCADPWDRDYVMDRHIYGETIPRLRAVPARLVLDPALNTMTRFAVLQQGTSHSPTLSAASSMGEALTVKPVGSRGTAIAQEFAVTLNADHQDREGTGRIRVFAPDDPSCEVIIPVMIQKRPIDEH